MGVVGEMAIRANRLNIWSIYGQANAGGKGDANVLGDVERPCKVGNLDSLQGQAGAFWTGKLEELIQHLEIPFVMEWKLNDIIKVEFPLLRTMCVMLRY